ncbi:FkbM family methyltransferase [Rhizobium lusitanum]|uniref:FkbM family methyltransferase n=1 Tax=Rhizobium lusitanum TaxID=293958 RepID=UPI001AEE6DAC|nr:FkbM family methyltransferase [Rhizobium lusitanum]
MFTSYAQNFEDVVLWRALKHVENGFYIDIGAQDPVVYSVSRAFYENGWRGIHAEATTYYAEQLRRDRPDELVVQAAIGTGDGPLRFFEIPETGLNTSSYDIAMKHQAAGHRVIETEVQLIPLSAVLARAGGREVHWLKVDVEGMEASVVDSWASSPIRPWIVVLESTLPNSQETNYEVWEPKLLSLGYRFVYFDGLSRFYVSERHPELLQSFGPGPNVFDDSALSEHTPYASRLRHQLTEQRIQAEKGAAEQTLRVDRLQQTVGEKEQQIEALENVIWNAGLQENAVREELHRTYSSFSWRFTHPFRVGASLLSNAKRLPRLVVAILLEKLIRWLSKRPQLKDKCLRLVYRFPGMRGRLMAFARVRGYGVQPVDWLDDGQEGQWYIDAPKGAADQWDVFLRDTSRSQ